MDLPAITDSHDENAHNFALETDNDSAVTDAVFPHATCFRTFECSADAAWVFERVNSTIEKGKIAPRYQTQLSKP